MTSYQQCLFCSFYARTTTQHPPKTKGQKLKPAAQQKAFFIQRNYYFSLSQRDSTLSISKWLCDVTCMHHRESECNSCIFIYAKTEVRDGGGSLFISSLCQLRNLSVVWINLRTFAEIQFGAPNAFWLPQKWVLECLLYFILVSHLMEIGADSTSLCRRAERKTFCCFSRENTLKSARE